MNKKAFVLLYICVLAFIIAIFVFYGSIGKQTPGGESLYLGEKEIALFQSYQEAEQTRYAIELAALLSAQQTSQENFETDFKATFAEYLKNYGLTIDDYSFVYEKSENTMTIIGKTEKVLEFKGENYIYTLTPNFKVTVPFEAKEETESSDNIFA
mgnify:CR=1 FL=1